HALVDAVLRHQLAVDRQKLVLGDRAGHVQLAQTALQPGEMAVEVQELAAEDGGHLIDAIGHEKAPVEDRDGGFGFGKILPVHIDGAAHAYPQSAAVGGWMPASSKTSGVSRSSARSSG